MSQPNRPVFMIEQLDDQRTRWTPMGTASENPDGSLTLHLNARTAPNAKLSVRPSPKPTQAPHAPHPVSVDAFIGDDGVAVVELSWTGPQPVRVMLADGTLLHGTARRPSDG